MQHRIFAVATVATLLFISAHAQQSHWASDDDQTARYIIDMERKWAEGVCADNGVGRASARRRFPRHLNVRHTFHKADELHDEKSEHIARECGLDVAKVHFFGDTVAVVYGREHAVGKDMSQPNAKMCQIWTDTWLKREGTWQIVASQDNRVECK